jgi:hypothetical protein
MKVGMETCFVSRWAKEVMDLERCDVRRPVVKGVIGLRVHKYRRVEKIYTTITIFRLLLYS